MTINRKVVRRLAAVNYNWPNLAWEKPWISKTARRSLAKRLAPLCRASGTKCPGTKYIANPLTGLCQAGATSP